MPRRVSNANTRGLRDLLIEAELGKYGPGGRWHRIAASSGGARGRR